MRVPAFQPAPHVNLDQFERHLRGQGVQQPSLEDPLSEWAGQAESSGRPSPSPPKSAANVPAPVGAGGSPTAAFATGAPWPSAETDEQPIESLDAELGALQANDDDLQTWDTGLSDEVIEDRFRSRRLIAPALALAGVLIIGSALALKVGVLGPVKQPPFVAATAPKAELKPAKDETVASSADTGSPLLKENIQSTETKVVREQPAGSSAVDETPTAATV